MPMMREYVEKIKDRNSNSKLEACIITYGCQMNTHDSERLSGLVEEMGYSFTDDVRRAKLVIFNTCCVRDGAEHRVYGNVGALKRKDSDCIVVVCGCMTQQESAARKIFKTFRHVDIVFGTEGLSKFPEMLWNALDSGERTLKLPDESGGEIVTSMRRGEPPLASVNIMQGCDNYCTYCIVPYVRGRERSRNVSDIVDEVREIVQSGYKEVLLLGQNVNSYAHGFPELLDAVSQTGIPRIRFMTSHPKDASKELFLAMARNENVCKQLHLPVQSGSNEILKRMNRRYTREQYLEKLSLAQSLIPGVEFTTDVIVGFPGETDEDFDKTMSLMREVNFSAAYTFVYSKRSGTPAADMPNQVSDDVKKHRISALVNLQNDITLKGNEKCVGKVETILVESKSARGEGVCGRTDAGRMVNIQGDDSLVGKLIKVRISEPRRTTLFGEII